MKFSIEEVKEAVNHCRSLSQVCTYLGVLKCRNTYEDLRNIIITHNIETSFDAKRKNKRYSTEEVFCKDSHYDKKSLRQRVIKEEVIPYQCQSCGITDWMGQPLSLQLDHINGDRWDNRVENLRFLCPNCHCQTPTWGNKK